MLLPLADYFSHYIDNLQVLMCHVDLTAVTFEPGPDDDYAIIHNFTIKNQCQVSDKIHQWARRMRGVPDAGHVGLGA